MRCSSVRISVPLPTPDGPVITKTRATGWSRTRLSLPAEHADQLGALALREAADGLARRDAALLEDLVDLDPAVLRHGEQHVEHLRRLGVLRRVEQEVMDGAPPGLEIALELRPPRADVVRTLKRVHPLLEGSLRGRNGCLGRWRHGRRVYIHEGDPQPDPREFGSTST